MGKPPGPGFEIKPLARAPFSLSRSPRRPPRPPTQHTTTLTLCSSLVGGVYGVVAALIRPGAYAGREAGSVRAFSTAATRTAGAFAGRVGMVGICGDSGARPGAGWASAKEAVRPATAAARARAEARGAIESVFERGRGKKGGGGGAVFSERGENKERAMRERGVGGHLRSAALRMSRNRRILSLACSQEWARARAGGAGRGRGAGGAWPGAIGQSERARAPLRRGPPPIKPLAGPVRRLIHPPRAEKNLLAIGGMTGWCGGAEGGAGRGHGEERESPMTMSWRMRSLAAPQTRRLPAVMSCCRPRLGVG